MSKESLFRAAREYLAERATGSFHTTTSIFKQKHTEKPATNHIGLAETENSPCLQMGGCIR